MKQMLITILKCSFKEKKIWMWLHKSNSLKSLVIMVIMHIMQRFSVQVFLVIIKFSDGTVSK